jgi:type II secretion system protein H
MRPERRFSQAGFTLTELLVVVTLIGIFAGVIVAEMRGTFADALLHSTARQMMSGLGLASSRAISLNQPYAFELSTADHKFTVRSKQNGRDSADEEKSPESGKIDERITVQIRDPDEPAEQEPRAEEPERPRMERDIIYFYPDGTADAREIVLRDKESVELVLRISPITGRVRVIEKSL